MPLAVTWPSASTVSANAGVPDTALATKTEPDRSVRSCRSGKPMSERPVSTRPSLIRSSAGLAVAWTTPSSGENRAGVPVPCQVHASPVGVVAR